MNNDFSAESGKGARWKTGRSGGQEWARALGGGAPDRTPPPLPPEALAALDDVGGKIRAIEQAMRARGIGGISKFELFTPLGRIHVGFEGSRCTRRLSLNGQSLDESPWRVRIQLADSIEQLHEDFIEAELI